MGRSRHHLADLGLEGEGPGEVGRQAAVLRIRHSVEEHAFDANVVVKIFAVAVGARRAAGVQVLQRRAMRGERHAPSRADGVREEEAADAAAPRGVGHDHVHGAALDHAAEVRDVVAVFAVGDFEAGGRTVAQLEQKRDAFLVDLLLLLEKYQDDV